MFETVFGEFPVRYYNYKDFDKTITDLVADTLKFTGENKRSNISSYTLKEIDNNIVFKCLAPSITKDLIDISIKDRVLKIKNLEEANSLEFFSSLNFTFNLSKEVDSSNSFAELVNGVLIVTMPLKESSSEKKITFK